MTTSAAATSTASTPPAPGPTGAVIAAVLVTMAAWASAFVAIRGVRDSFDPGALALGRLSVGAVALGVAVVVRRAWVQPTRREWLLVLVCGVAWFGVYNVALNAAEQRLDAGTAATLVNVGPILIALLAGALLGEGFPRWLLIGAGVAFTGTVVIAAATTHSAAADLAGVLLCLLAAAAWAIGIMAQKPALRGLPALQVTFLAARSEGWPACHSPANWRTTSTGRPAAAWPAWSIWGWCPRPSRSAPGPMRCRGWTPAGWASLPTWCRR
jgi:drug/metabolite transporter (DMT)-like permease